MMKEVFRLLNTCFVCLDKLTYKITMFNHCQAKKRLNKLEIFFSFFCLVCFLFTLRILSHPRTKRKKKSVLHANLSGVLKCIQFLSLPVKCSRLKLIVRANHLYSPLTRNRKKCDPVTLAAIVFLCGGKENILVCKALLPWIICLLPL